MTRNHKPPDEHLPRQRWRLLAQFEDWLEWPLILLGLIWLILLIFELVSGLSPFLIRVGEIIWGIFIVDFVFRLILAPRRGLYLRRNWLSLIALALPALRVLRLARVLRAFRGVRLVRIVGSINRGMRSLGRSMSRRGLRYVVASTFVVLFTGAAGMYAFERVQGTEGLSSYTEALWWTAMLLTTMGSGTWPESPEGRALALLLSLYALGILGYVAGTLATLFIGEEAESPDSEVASKASVQQLRDEIMRLRAELRQRG